MKIVTSYNLSTEDIALARTVAPNVCFASAATVEDMMREIEDAEAFFGYGLKPEMIKKAKNLRWIQFSSVGVESVLSPELLNSDVVLTNARGATAINISEHVMSLILAIARTLHTSIINQTNKFWENFRKLPVLEISGDTLGIIGLGSIGIQVAHRAHAFGMRILAVDPTQTEKPAEVDSLWKMDRLHDMLGKSDFVAICCPLTPETTGMIGTAEFNAMKSTAILITIGRGQIIDQAALVEALQSKKIAGAGLDVTDPEPLPQDSPLWEMDNVIITPHHAGASPKSWTRIYGLFCENLRRFVAGEPLTNIVDQTRGY
ncbi:MAG: D-2-hydroxyacid dehydrogenase [Candidatus Poribacteria bacterium]|nr:D-2-hydroxyacid dehydrogenase [Candidatus Poribacteria bacterium]MDE0503417.1 D-2-hydroxyacid dehydrogenase [Candidatus Poribacteria bacterium]